MMACPQVAALATVAAALPDKPPLIPPTMLLNTLPDALDAAEPASALWIDVIGQPLKPSTAFLSVAS